MKPIITLVLVLTALLSVLHAQVNDTTMTVDFTVTTSSPGGNFSPRNIGAIWVEDANGSFVKTLRIWADRRIQYLYTWNSHSGGNTVDGITGATYSSHGTRTAPWDFTDVDGNTVPPGEYQLRLEMTDQHSQGPMYSFSFPFMGSSETITPPDQSNFHNMSLTYDLTIIPGGNFCYEIVTSNNWYADLEAVLAAQGFGLRDGDTLMFSTDGGTYYTPDNVVLPAVGLTIMADPALENKPVIMAGSSSTILKALSNVTVEGIAFNGLAQEAGANAPYRLLRAYADLSKMTVRNCEFYNARGFGITSHGPLLDSLVVENCRFYDIAENAVSFKDVTSLVDYVSIRNSSFWNIGDVAIYVWATEDQTEVDHCTFYDIQTRCVYPKECLNLTTVTNNIFVSNGGGGIKIYGASPLVEYNCFFNNSLDIEYIGDPPLTFPNGNLYADPLFQDCAVANFCLASTSPCVTSAGDGGNMGDPVWGMYEVIAVDPDKQNLPKTAVLLQNYPNPFNPSTQIQYTLPKPGQVQITVFDLQGRQVANLVNTWQTAGRHAVLWAGTDALGNPVTAGVYLCHFQTADEVQTIKMVNLK